MLKYIGTQALVGFPPKDLSDAEILDHAKKFLLQSGQYVEEQQPVIKPVTKKTKAEKESES